MAAKSLDRVTDDVLADMLDSLGAALSENLMIRPRPKSAVRYPSPTLCRKAAERLRTLAKMDREAATHVEIVICMRTDFTGDPPYVGWKGLGLALKEALDERDSLRRLRNGDRAARTQE